MRGEQSAQNTLETSSSFIPFPHFSRWLGSELFLIRESVSLSKAMMKETKSKDGFCHEGGQSHSWVDEKGLLSKLKWPKITKECLERNPQRVIQRWRHLRITQNEAFQSRTFRSWSLRHRKLQVCCCLTFRKSLSRKDSRLKGCLSCRFLCQMSSAKSSHWFVRRDEVEGETRRETNIK